MKQPSIIILMVLRCKKGRHERFALPALPLTGELLTAVIISYRSLRRFSLFRILIHLAGYSGVITPFGAVFFFLAQTTDIPA